MKNGRIFKEEPKEGFVKSLYRGPWLINYRLQGGKIVYLLWTAKGLDFLKNWDQE